MFQSFFMGGFECSTHRLRSGKRLDVTAATCHDKIAVADYQSLQQQGIYTVREGLRWHLIEQSPEKYDFSSAGPIIRAARDTKMQVIWDLFHYGWPREGPSLF
jgi:GH35 family endo-1,4-beta-xylanase